MTEGLRRAEFGMAEARDEFARAAYVWAAGGAGQDLVDAAVSLLIAGCEDPLVARLAGAPKGEAAWAAHEFGVPLFEALGLHIAERGSNAALVDLTRQLASDLLTGRQASCRALAADVWGLFSESQYQADLGELAGFNEEYYLLDEGICGDEAEIDERVRRAANRFLEEHV